MASKHPEHSRFGALRRNWGKLLVLVVILGSAMAFQHQMIRQFFAEPYKYRDPLYVPSEGYLDAVTVGYDNFFADFFWLRMIQSFAAGWTQPENAEQMITYFDGITSLDPYYKPVYGFTIMAVGEEGQRDDLVQQVVLDSLQKMPGNWEVLRDGAFYAGWTMDDPDLAKYYVRLAMASPISPDYLRRWISYFEVKQGRFEAAFEKYLVDYLQSLREGGDRMTMMHDRHLRRAVNAWYTSVLQDAAERYYAQHQSGPTLDQLREQGYLDDVRLPDWAAVTRLIAQVGEAGEAGFDALEEFGQADVNLQAFAGNFIRTFESFPSSGPYDDLIPQGLEGYSIWTVPTEEPPFKAVSNLQLLNTYQGITEFVDGQLQLYKQNNNGECPPDLQTIAYDIAQLRDPLGGEFKLESENGDCRFVITSVPNIRTLEIESVE